MGGATATRVPKAPACAGFRGAPGEEPAGHFHCGQSGATCRLQDLRALRGRSQRNFYCGQHSLRERLRTNTRPPQEEETAAEASPASICTLPEEESTALRIVFGSSGFPSANNLRVSLSLGLGAFLSSPLLSAR